MNGCLNIMSCLHYFLLNLFYLEMLPSMVYLKNNGNEYYSCVYYDTYRDKGIWVAMYSKLIKRDTDTEILFEVKSRYRYILFLKVVFALWKTRNNIKLATHNY